MTSESAPGFVLHPSVHTPGDGIWFVTPPGFTALPLEALVAPPGSFVAKGLDNAVAPLLAAAPDEKTRQVLVGNLARVQQMFHTLLAKGTVHCSLGVHRDDTGEGDGSVLLSLFTITWVHTAWAPRSVNAARAVTTAEGHTCIAYVDLPSGPVAFSEAVLTPARDSGLRQQPLLQVYAHLPHPDGTSMAVLTLNTPATSHREHYRSLLRRITELVSFDNPFTSVVDREGCR